MRMWKRDKEPGSATTEHKYAIFVDGFVILGTFFTTVPLVVRPYYSSAWCLTDQAENRNSQPDLHLYRYRYGT